MWTQYRRWKHALVLPLIVAGNWLMRGEPDASPRWVAGMSIAAVLVVGYLAEEIVWAVQKRGRPCDQCGERIHLTPFSLRIRCPHCGRLFT